MGIANSTQVLIYWQICEVYLSVAIDVNFISEAKQNKQIEVAQVNKKHSCLKFANIFNCVLALAFLVLFVISFANNDDGLKNLLWAAYTVVGFLYLLLWSGVLVFLFRKINEMVTRILPDSKMFITMAGLLFSSLIFNSLSIYLFLTSQNDQKCAISPDCA